MFPLNIRPFALHTEVYLLGSGGDIGVAVLKHRPWHGSDLEIRVFDRTILAWQDVELRYWVEARRGWYGIVRSVRARLEFEPASGWTLIHPSGAREAVRHYAWPGANFAWAHIKDDLLA